MYPAKSQMSRQEEKRVQSDLLESHGLRLRLLEWLVLLLAQL
jgi:hypothetical protein